jgi:hypothetical protein
MPSKRFQKRVGQSIFNGKIHFFCTFVPLFNPLIGQAGKPFCCDNDNALSNRKSSN